MRRLFLIGLILTPLLTFAQQESNYNDVAVIVNDNSDVSIEIGNYFQQKRNIPEKNIIHINTVEEEDIDSLTFEGIREQVETYLISNNLTSSINYLVTTKGVPLKVNIGNLEIGNISSYLKCASVDSELSLILSELNSHITTKIKARNPYLKSDNYFSRNEYDIYLVTRLDGYSVNDVINLIDRSGPNIPINKPDSKIIFDISHVAESNTLDQIAAKYRPQVDIMKSDGWNTIYDPEIPLLTDQNDVLGYFSINYEPSNKVLNNEWLQGSVGEINFAFSASTFYRNKNKTNDLIVADLISEGACGAIGYPYYSWLNGSFYNNYFLDSYFNLNFNLAESYFKAIPHLSAQYIVIGDPKTSLEINHSTTNTTKHENTIEIYPNPCSGKLFIQVGEFNFSSIEIYNPLGQLIKKVNPSINQELIEVDLSTESKGIYLVCFSTENKRAFRKVLLSK